MAFHIKTAIWASAQSVSPYSSDEFIEVAAAVIAGPLSKDPDLARHIAERLSLRTRDVRQAIHVAQLCDTREEVERFEAGAEPGKLI